MVNHPALPRHAEPFWGPVLGSSSDHLRDHHDVVVVGAGITGLSTALLLAQRGVDVAVVEARRPGAGTTSRSSAKVTLLQGTRLGEILATHGPEVAQAYLTANQHGQQLVHEVLATSDVDHEIRDAWTYTVTEQGMGPIAQEHTALVELGLPGEFGDAGELPFHTRSAVRLPNQLQINPSQYLAALEALLSELGVPIVLPVRVADVAESEGQLRVTTHDGLTVTAQWAVLATLMPFPRRTLVFANSSPSRSYMLACRTRGPKPQGMYLSADSPTRSLRTARSAAGEEFLLVGGNDHHTGKDTPTHQHIDALAQWAADTFDVIDITHRWSAQDYSSVDLLPQIGRAPLGPRGVLFATGLAKWGMTNGSGAARILADIITGTEQPWAAALQPRLAGSLPGLGRLVTMNAEIGADLLAGWTTRPGSATPEGQGAVTRHFPTPRAISTIDGRRQVCSAVCTHLGGIVSWNDADETWDCPLHGSVFATDGAVREGPAVHAISAADGEQR